MTPATSVVDARTTARAPGTLLAVVETHDGERPLLGTMGAADVLTAVAHTASALRGAGLADGEVVGFSYPPGPGWVVGLLAHLAVGARPLLLSSDVPEAEVRRLLERAGGRRWVVPGSGGPEVHGSGAPDVHRVPGAAGGSGPGVVLVTSGSTGRPKTVFRSEASLLAEAGRYVRGVGLGPLDRIVLPLPLSHAYGLGWLAASLVAGACVEPMAPSALSDIADELSQGATVAALVPSMARLLVDVAPSLVKRGRIRAPAVGCGALRLVMVGAGPVDTRLDERFRAAFGIGLARNYGSTETGAVFAGPPQLPTACVGTALPGVHHRIVDDTGRIVADAGPGSLEVLLEGDEEFRPMHDLARLDALGRLHLLGRRSAAARRGDRFVAPLEVEAVLADAPGVADVRVRRVTRTEGDDALVADVVAQSPGSFDAAAVLDFARHRLASYKVPDALRVRDRLPRNRLGKLVEQRPLSVVSDERLRAGARRYRASEVVFALSDLGVLGLLDGRRDAESIAAGLGLRAPELELLLDAGVACGVLHDSTPAPNRTAPAVPDLAGEAAAARSGMVREALCHAVRGDAVPVAATLPATVADDHADARARAGLRSAHWHAAASVLEIAPRPGRYVALAELLGGTGERATLALRPGADRDTCGDDARWDLVVVEDVVHGPGPGDDLGWLRERLVGGGTLLIDDRFVAPAATHERADLLVDAVLGGATSWLTLEELEGGLAASGIEVTHRLAFADARAVVVARAAW